MHANAVVRRFFTPLLVLVSIALGFLFPDIGALWKPYLSVLLALLMFFVSLTIEPREIKESVKSYSVVALALLMVFVVTPLLALSAKLLFSSEVYVGTVLAFSSPSAIVTPFWAGVFSGDVATALVVSTTANLLAVVTVPLTMIVAVGSAVSVDMSWMVQNLAVVILVPFGAAFLFRKALSVDATRINAYSSKVELAILVLLVWGSVADGAVYARSHAVEFAFLNVFMLCVLGLAFAVAYLVGRRFGRRQAVTFGIAACVKNAALALVVGVTGFGPAVLPPLVANLIAQNLLVVLLGIFIRDGAKPVPV